MPYKSKAQAAYFNIHRKELEHQGVNVEEWNKASKGKKLPEHVDHDGNAKKVMSKAAKHSNAHNNHINNQAARVIKK